MKSLKESLMMCSLLVQRFWGETWHACAKDLLTLQAETIVPWSVEGLLENDTACKALLDNTTGHSRCGPLAIEAQQMAKSLKALVEYPRHEEATPVLVPPTVAKSLKEAAAKGIEMVVYTFAVWLVRIEFPSYAIEKVMKGTDTIRAKFKAHRVLLPKELADVLDGFDKGTIAVSTYQMKHGQSTEPAVAAGSSVPVVPVVPPLVTPSSSSASSFPSSDGGSDKPAEPQPAGQPAPKRQRLADKLRARAAAQDLSSM